jgi:hypothetical protein
MAEKKKKKKKAAAINEMREKIDVLGLIEALELHVLGHSKMTATQVSAALALLRKTLPDLLSVPVQKLLRKAAPPKAHEDALKELE